MDTKYRAALRQVAEAANNGSWSIAPCNAETGLYNVGLRMGRGGVSPIAEYLDEPHAFHIAAFDPVTVLALLDHIDGLEKGIGADNVSAPLFSGEVPAESSRGG